MNKKTIIQIVVIVCAFGAAGYVLYSGLVKKAPVPAMPIGGPAQSQQASAPVNVPKVDGVSLDEQFKVLSKNGLQYGIVTYPQLSTDEVGVPLKSLVKPLPSPTPAK